MRAVVIAVLIALLGCVPYRATAAPPPPTGAIVGSLGPNSPLSLPFAAEAVGLAGVQVWLSPGLPDSRGSEPLVARLRASAPALPDLAAVEVPVAQLQSDGPTTMVFPALPPLGAPGERVALELVLEAPGLPDGASIGLYGGPEAALQPLYTRRPIDWLLPVSSMAAGRPGPLGWPALYAALAAGFVGGLVAASRRLWAAGLPGAD